MPEQKAHLLLVEDETPLRLALADLLADAGFHVVQAHAGEEAVAALSQFAFDIVLTDLRLPGLAGTGVLDAALDRYPDILVVVMTGYGTVRDAVALIKRGAADLITKPFQSEELLHVLHGALEQRRLRNENAYLRSQLQARYRFELCDPAHERTDRCRKVAAAPVDAPATSAILSSGTWSLLGLELDKPLLDARARAANLTNERGVDGTTRLLKNVMGLWLLQECRRAWARQGMARDYDALARMAAAEHGEVALFDPDDPGLLMPGPMPARIVAACERTGQRAPATPAAIVRSILVSLACKYRWTLERLEAVSGREVRRIHVIGGGTRNDLLCRLTADLCGREVLAGPVEATALGNVLVQARAVGELGSLAEMRAVAAASADPAVFEPGEDGDQIYQRFLEVTGQNVKETVP